MNRSIWNSTSQIVKKPWGHENQWTTLSALDGKVLYINAGCRTSLKMFEHKDEVLFVQAGMIQATVADEELFSKNTAQFRKIVLHEGDVLNIQAGCPYRLEALNKDAIVVEISNGGAYTQALRFMDDYDRDINSRYTPLIKKKLEELNDIPNNG